MNKLKWIVLFVALSAWVVFLSAATINFYMPDSHKENYALISCIEHAKKLKAIDSDEIYPYHAVKFFPGSISVHMTSQDGSSLSCTLEKAYEVDYPPFKLLSGIVYRPLHHPKRSYEFKYEDANNKKAR
jgi:hypothetical protein